MIKKKKYLHVIYVLNKCNKYIYIYLFIFFNIIVFFKFKIFFIHINTNCFLYFQYLFVAQTYMSLNEKIKIHNTTYAVV